GNSTVLKELELQGKSQREKNSGDLLTLGKNLV
ncbi:unnamed protein product, partial [Allacma fusca]